MLLSENILIYSSEIEERGKKFAISIYEQELRSIPACHLEILIWSLSPWKSKSIYLPQSWRKFDLIGLTAFLVGLDLWDDPQENNEKKSSGHWRQSRSSSGLLRPVFYKRNDGRKRLNQVQHVSSIKSCTCIPDDFPFLSVLFLSCLCFGIIISWWFRTQKNAKAWSWLFLISCFLDG